ncbi:MAG: YdcF family protein, partial [Verrucomicrobiota bacterium]
AFGLFFIITNPFIHHQLMNWWEPEPLLIEEITEPFDVAIVLGGFADPLQPPRDRIHFNLAANRLTQAIELYMQGKVRKILIAGGSASVVSDKVAESTSVLPFLENLNIPRSDILLEDRSRNTYENAIHSTELLARELPGARVLLVTSAFHMRRAMACFQQAGQEFTPFPTDLRNSPIHRPTPDRLIMPSNTAFLYWNKVIKEWVGLAFYKVRGYI